MSAIKPNAVTPRSVTTLDQSSFQNDDSVSNSDTIQGNEIWLLLDSQTFGGIETHVLELAQGLIKHQQGKVYPVRVVLLTQFTPESSIVERLQTLKLPFSYLCNLASQHISSQSNNALTQLNQAIQQHRPVLVHAHGYKSSLISKLAKMSQLIRCRSNAIKVRQVSTYHAGETPTGRVWLYDWLDRYSGFISDAALVVSEKIKQKLPSHSYLLNNFVQPIAVDSTRADNIHHDTITVKTITKRVGFVGRLSHEKAPDRFIELAKQFPEIEFHVFGDGPLRVSLDKGQRPNLTFHGHQTNMEMVWPKIDLLVIPSRYEGLPMAALEAMARRIPVLASAVGNLPQLIDHAKNGYLAQSPQELFEHLATWHSLSLKQSQVMAADAQHTINEAYSPDAVIPQILAIYKLTSPHSMKTN